MDGILRSHWTILRVSSHVKEAQNKPASRDATSTHVRIAKVRKFLLLMNRVLSNAEADEEDFSSS